MHLQLPSLLLLALAAGSATASNVTTSDFQLHFDGFA
jgi:hypothetical protein